MIITAEELKKRRIKNKETVIKTCLSKIEQDLVNSAHNPCSIRFSTFTTPNFSKEICEVLKDKGYTSVVTEVPSDHAIIYTISWKE